jgi:hypothetical protein
MGTCFEVTVLACYKYVTIYLENSTALPLTFLQMYRFIASHSATPNLNSKRQKGKTR